MKKREVIDTVKGFRTQDGAGVSLVRVLGHSTVGDFDPFLMLDSFDSENPDDYIAGFPTHPHRGIETITYLVNGEMDHEDTLGNKGKILSGDAQWMTAGSGILHSEMPKPTDRLLGLQLWINLPKDDKMTTPKYFDIKAKDMPTKDYGDYTVKVISGEFDDLKGATPHHLQATLYDIALKNGKKIEIPTKPNEKVFIFTLLGECKIDGKLYDEKTAILFNQGDSIEVEGASDDLRFTFYSAPILDEDVAWGGPIVMNTREELNQAFIELEEGTFIKERPEE
ncbi:pirin family protein [Miniphocaeibacter halophilus]|uniref:Pirin family protein n=1 Tax=Miniphocaeibacter halophilus TaxID=2931922 RepID=A0AC61MSF4_9FIRM|nr:pirin family protein [Miniphocaeibacter halophilus]QQK08575.1 pirin family protein [Miniphocaeibacter halophilus]